MTEYQTHVAAWKNCRRCPLWERRTKVVLARGSLPAEVLFVGEAPGPSEDLIGVPFIGPAGRFLDSMIDESYEMAGLEGAPRVAFTNLVACIPLEKDGDKFEQPPDKSVQKCSPRLVKFFALAQPKLLVCVGNVAEAWLAPSTKGKGRGVDLGSYDAIPTVCVTHPAAILRANDANKDLMRRRVVVRLANAWAQVLKREHS